jgi:hypothetical protein
LQTVRLRNRCAHASFNSLPKKRATSKRDVWESSRPAEADRRPRFPGEGEGPRHFRTYCIQSSFQGPSRIAERLDSRSAFREPRLRWRCQTSAEPRLGEGGNLRLPLPLRQPIFFGDPLFLRSLSAFLASMKEERPVMLCLTP